MTTSAPASPPWATGLQLRCILCATRAPASPAWAGCAACRGPLVADYSLVDGPPHELLPVPAGRMITLGEAQTPLIRYRSEPAVWLKLEGQNPTGSHKDRFHSLSITIARDLGYRAAVTSSTGNHGAACAAYAARAGLRCLVLLHPDSPAALRSQIRSTGADIAIVPGHERALVQELSAAGWYPSTSADPLLAGGANPYGQEAYKAIAHEIVADLGGQPPGCVAVPAASGDTLYGIWRGFRDLHERSSLAMPVILACQPAWTAPLDTTTDGRRASAPSHPALALSASDPQAGRHAQAALDCDGIAIPVSETELIAALRELSGAGFCVEPASALTLAGLTRARAQQLAALAGPAVCVMTSSGLNWTRDLDAALGLIPHILDTAAAVRTHAGLGPRVLAEATGSDRDPQAGAGVLSVPGHRGADA